jgi:hypothetical protein
MVIKTILFDYLAFERGLNSSRMGKQIIVFSDTHYSKNWDVIDHCLGQTPDHSDNYLNPNKEFKKFIRLINQSPKVEAVINNGDSVDYHFADFRRLSDLLTIRPDSERTSNQDLFNQLIAGLTHPYIAIPGNHDYRKEAYNYAIWGTDHVNLSRQTRERYRDQIGHQTFRGPWELTSIMVNEKQFDPLKKGRFIKKRANYLIAGYHCIFLDNGSDAFVRPANFLKYLKKMFQTRMLSYDTNGLAQEDLDYISCILSTSIQKDILIFQHTPLINPQTSRIGREYQLSIDTFHALTRKQKLSCHTILNGGARLLNILRNTHKNIVLVSSHIHHARYFLIDKNSLKAREVSNREFNQKKDAAGFIKHLTTLPLGNICPKNGGNKTGYLTISSNGFEEQVFHAFK